MSFDGIASVQSRIAAIQEKIAALSNQGRPPVAITELEGKNPSAATKSTDDTIKPSTSPFASEYAKQISSAEVGKSSLFHGRDKIQGQPGTAEAFVARVKSYIGVPYVWGGTNPEKGLDCSGLVQTAAREVGVKLPRVTYDQQHAGQEVDGIENAKPGDLIICRKSGHVAVYIGNNRVIHAPRPGKHVTEASVEDMGPIDTIRRVMRSEDDPDIEVTETPTAARVASNATLAQLLAANPRLGAATGDLAQTLVSQLSGRGSANTTSAGYLGTLQGGIGTISQNTQLLSQLMGAGAWPVKPSLTPNGATSTNLATSANLAPGTAAANAALTTTASSLGAMSALRSSLGV